MQDCLLPVNGDPGTLPWIQPMTNPSPFVPLPARFPMPLRRAVGRALLAAGLLPPMVCALPAPAAETAPVVYVIPVQGPIEEALLYVMRRGVAEAERARADALILHMHTPGGTVGAAKDIVSLMVNTRIPTYTFVDKDAFSAGAIIALATDHIYMAPGSVIGDAMPILVSPFGGPQELPEDVQEKQVSAVAALIRSAAEQGGHDKELAEAMVRRENVFEVGGVTVSAEGELLTLTNIEAERPLGPDGAPLLSRGTVADIDALLEEIDLAGADVRTFAPTGSERIARFIKLLAPLFLGAGLLGLWVEFKTPGVGIPGLLGALSLVIFFWGHHIAGLAGAEEVLIVLLGLGFLAAEIFVFPGFGFAGITGLFLIFWGLLLAMVQHYPGGPLMPSWDAFTSPIASLSGGMLIAVGLGFVIIRYLPEGRAFRGLRLDAATRAEDGFTASRQDYQSLLNARGESLTALRPAGMATIEDRRLDVVTDGEFIEPHQPIRVVEIHGNRIVVEAV